MMMMVLHGYCLQWLWENTICSYFSEVSQHHAENLNIFVVYVGLHLVTFSTPALETDQMLNLKWVECSFASSS